LEIDGDFAKQPIDLINKSNATIKNINGGPIMMVLLSWFNKFHDNLKFKYDVTILIGWTFTLLYLLSPLIMRRKKIYIS